MERYRKNKKYLFIKITSICMPAKKPFLIITLARNEESTITNILKKSLEYGDVLLINDASVDNTLKLAKNCQ